MTLIAGFCFERVPMLLGDLLLSSPHPSGEQHIELPSVGDSREIIKPDWGYALDLCQKIFLVNRFTAVSWCGSYIKAKGLLTEFQTLAGDQRLSSAREKDFLSAISSDNYYADVSLIGMTAISGMESRFFGCNFYNRANEHFSPCLYAGSGGVDFPGTAELRPPILADGSSVDRATSVAYSLIGAFLTREINARSLATDTTPNPLLDLYGGGWELAFVDEGSVFKHKNTTEFFWKLNEHDDGTLEIQAPSLIMNNPAASGGVSRPKTTPKVCAPRGGELTRRD